MTRTIDLNADMGEYANTGQQTVEAKLMPLISSCSIACGGHAGDAETMRETAQLARQHGVSIGAHPSYPDRESFGRRRLTIDAGELRASLQTQIAALNSILKAKKTPLNHVKPHGALYNDAARKTDLAFIIVEAAQAVSPSVILVGPPGSALEKAAAKNNMSFAAEGFVDRLYQKNGALTPRSTPGAVIGSLHERAQQGLGIARGDKINAADGALQLAVQTLCIHSDSPNAVETAQALRSLLEMDGFIIQSFA